MKHNRTHSLTQPTRMSADVGQNHVTVSARGVLAQVKVVQRRVIECVLRVHVDGRLHATTAIRVLHVPLIWT